MSFSLYYKKNKNDNLFRELENSNLQLNSLQNYIPLYESFFSLNESNYNNINLNHKFHLHSIVNTTNLRNILTVKIIDNSNNIKETDLFCKFSPLLDPLKLLTGKYDSSLNLITNIPSLNNQDICIPKLVDKNNNSYVDGFFSYLSSQLLHNYNFINGIDYYGSFLAIQNDFIYNIVDDFSYLNESSYFHNNTNKKFFIENKEFENILNIDSRNNKKKIIINENLDNIKIDDLNEIDFPLLTTSNNNESQLIVDLSEVCIYNTILTKKDDSDDSSCSSKSSNTSINTEIMDDDSMDDESESSIESEEEDVFCKINEFPIQLICLEKCENTLDFLMENDKLNENEWISCLFQVIITLSVYQKTFSFTHNDLHTNNIMYIPTDKQYIHYCFNGIYYKVPTYGKIYKIIDYGRAIYKYNGKIMCSDSFHPKGDAASQYNFEPFFDSKKPRLEPNNSFDLCRLACCIFDYFIDDVTDSQEIIKKNKIASIINSWLLDDKGRNILYKTDGEERYPEFKLYKMIARTIHNAIPEKQLSNELFRKYIVTKKTINKKTKIVNLDLIPDLTNEYN
uniref:Protein kinase domain-containing protein n=1 Tax=viral metagenome TaxID=1070528 RepID=A0A6C0CL70_9ZZZZ